MEAALDRIYRNATVQAMNGFVENSYADVFGGLTVDGINKLKKQTKSNVYGAFIEESLFGQSQENRNRTDGDLEPFIEGRGRVEAKAHYASNTLSVGEITLYAQNATDTDLKEWAKKVDGFSYEDSLKEYVGIKKMMEKMRNFVYILLEEAAGEWGRIHYKEIVLYAELILDTLRKRIHTRLQTGQGLIAVHISESWKPAAFGEIKQAYKVSLDLGKFMEHDLSEMYNIRADILKEIKNDSRFRKKFFGVMNLEQFHALPANIIKNKL